MCEDSQRSADPQREQEKKKQLKDIDSRKCWWCCCWVAMSPALLWPYRLAHQAPLSTGFPKQEYWSRLPFPSPGALSKPGIEPMSPALAGGFSTTEPPGKPAKEVCRTQRTQFSNPKEIWEETVFIKNMLWKYNCWNRNLRKYSNVENKNINSHNMREKLKDIKD